MTPEDMQERDIVEFTDDNGNTLMLEVMDYFYYNGQEFAALCNANENPGDDDPSKTRTARRWRNSFPRKKR